MNFIFISPNFPSNYYHFCQELRKNGVNVLGIGDCPYDELDRNVRLSLNEYYKVSTLENYDEVYRAVAFFAFKYGRIDWLESNNEYWLEQDAALRTDFNIPTGFHTSDMRKVKYKSEMKKYYAKAGIPAARWYIADTLENTQKFIDSIGGYPVIIKPDNGVGAGDTHKLKNADELAAFFARKPEEPYICEEMVKGVVCSYDAIINSKGKPIFETGNVSPISIMDIVNEAGNSYFYMVKNLPDDVRNYGRKAVKVFGVKSRFIHFEFFRLYEDQEGLGKKGDVVGLEVNLRPSGGVSPDMHNFANSTDVYKIWADMIVYDSSEYGQNGQHYYCGFGGRRAGRNFVMNHEEIMQKFGHKIVMQGPVQAALSSAMGDYMYMGRFDTEEEMNQFIREIFAEK
ncbi:MAG: carbamoylphosphate synthase large subunit [Lachnospiraceae bacterium]|nr:carbamoylphosphate synthase large subunit [Lachnospiraceae bacterium]